jgi:uncharacterized protein
MNGASWLAVAGASLLGSVHCAAMCGGFVAAYTDGEGANRTERALSHLFYNAGRLVTYSALGALAGALGRALDLAGRAAGIAEIAGLTTGVLLVCWGLSGLSQGSRLVQLKTRAPRAITSRLTSLLAGFSAKPRTARAALLGLTSTLLPCGWLYAFAALAAGTGSAAAGALLMSAFWVGSLPMLLGLGVALQTAARRLHARVPRLRAGLVTLVGVATLLLRVQLPAFAAGAPTPIARASGSALPTAADCPCHKQKHAVAPATDDLPRFVAPLHREAR